MLWITVALAGGVDRVPEDFPTIQAAVDAGQGEVISVAAGRWAGARVDRPVALEGRPGAIVDVGVSVGPLEVGFWLVDGADGVEIAGFGVDCDAQVDAGVFSSARRGGIARDVMVFDNRFRSCVQGVTVSGDGGPARWEISGNRFDGTRALALSGASGGSLGVVAYGVSAVDVVGNGFVGWIEEDVGFSSAGVALGGCVGCGVVGNVFAARGALLWRGPVVADEGGTRELVVADNDARGEVEARGARLERVDGLLATGNVGGAWDSR